MTDLASLDLMGLPAAERAVVEQWDAELRTVTEPITKALGEVARRMGVGYSTALRKWYAWQAKGIDRKSVV